LGIAFVGTANARALGAGSFSYLLTLAPAAGAGVGLLAFGSMRARLLVGLSVAVVGTANIAGIIQGRAGTPLGELGRHERQVVQFLVQKHVTRGYAGYWDAQNLSWQSGMRVLAAPVGSCGLPEKPLCPYAASVIASWYREQPGPSFLIVDPTTGFVTTPPSFVKDASGLHHFGRLSVYIFPYDIARHIQFWR
jgi:hypothetical protein